MAEEVQLSSHKSLPDTWTTLFDRFAYFLARLESNMCLSMIALTALHGSSFACCGFGIGLRLNSCRLPIRVFIGNPRDVQDFATSNEEIKVSFDPRRDERPINARAAPTVAVFARRRRPMCDQREDIQVGAHVCRCSTRTCFNLDASLESHMDCRHLTASVWTTACRGYT